MKRRAQAVLIGGALLLAAASVHAAKKPKTVDTFWTYPDYQKIKVERIAVIPAASYDNNIQTETTVEQALGMQLKGQKYRWVSASTTRDLLRSMTGSDSLLKAVKAQILKEPRVDSLTAQRLCSMIHCDALLSTRVDSVGATDDRVEPVGQAVDDGPAQGGARRRAGASAVDGGREPIVEGRTTTRTRRRSASRTPGSSASRSPVRAARPRTSKR